MIKSNFKLLMTFIIILLLSISPICLATDASDVMLISETVQNANIQIEKTTSDTRFSDIYVSNENQYNIINTVEGNVFAKVDTLNIESKNNNAITGNVYAIAKDVNIKSDIKFSETEKDEFGNSQIDSINSISIIYGNVFVIADKFVLEPSCEIEGDLYIYANEIELSQNSVVSGNVFASSKNFILNGKIDGDLYANAKNFDMKYYGFVRRDLHLNSEIATINGYLYRNSFINSNKITTNKEFINEYDLNIESASTVLFSGEVKGTANINSKNIEFKNKATDNNNITCKISGDLNYSSKKELDIPTEIVSGNINYSKYKSFPNLLSNIGEFILNLFTTLTYVLVIYFIINKFMPKYKEKLSNLSIRDIIISLGIGIIILILVPVISILLFVTKIGSLLGLLLLALYIFLLILSKSIFVISIASMIKKRSCITNEDDSQNDSNSSVQTNSLFINIIKVSLITLTLSLISLIPSFGFIVSVLVLIAGLGIFVKSIKKCSLSN